MKKIILAGLVAVFATQSGAETVAQFLIKEYDTAWRSVQCSVYAHVAGIPDGEHQAAWNDAADKMNRFAKTASTNIIKVHFAVDTDAGTLTGQGNICASPLWSISDQDREDGKDFAAGRAYGLTDAYCAEDAFDRIKEVVPNIPLSSSESERTKWTNNRALNASLLWRSEGCDVVVMRN
ncbi:hypothetical protein [Ruegeria atlantica]|uniref:Uncharacterized protein n=1 Tax=Ruegeria atlantica TaxID=81569 RepID=A0A0P1EAR8_9RHOB|nr:hypothetical protein [Ruegeria atlantica]CUH46483.1 hypothetical protein RUA4292_00649 [Ruegeria atlantica]